MFNPYIVQYIGARLMFEMPASGGVFASEYFMPFRLERFQKYRVDQSSPDVALISAEVVVFLCWLRLMYDEYRDMRLWVKEFKIRHKLAKASRVDTESWVGLTSDVGHGLLQHLCHDWNGVDIIVVLLLLGFYVIRSAMQLESLRLWSPDLRHSHTDFFNFHWIAQLYLWEQQIIAGAIMICWLKVVSPQRQRVSVDHRGAGRPGPSARPPSLQFFFSFGRLRHRGRPPVFSRVVCVPEIRHTKTGLMAEMRLVWAATTKNWSQKQNICEKSLDKNSVVSLRRKKNGHPHSSEQIIVTTRTTAQTKVSSPVLQIECTQKTDISVSHCIPGFGGVYHVCIPTFQSVYHMCVPPSCLLCGGLLGS